MSKQKKKIQITYSELNSGIVTGSNHYLEIKVHDKTTNIMLDIGAVQSGKLSLKESFLANRIERKMNDIDYVIISHSHLDHVMNMCQLSRLDFNGVIYMTDLTLNIAEHISQDGINIHQKAVEYLSKKNQKKGTSVVPYMDMRSRQFALDRVRAYDYNKWVQLEEGIKFKLVSNGHVAGSSSVVIEISDGYEKETILYMSDTSCQRDIPFTKKLNIEKMKITTAIIESTYGSVHIPQKTEQEIIEELYIIIKSACIERKANVLLPVFAFARSTNLAYYIKKTYEKYPELNEIPVFMISPLMDKCHNSISKGKSFYDEKWKNEMDLFTWDKIQHITEYQDMIIISRSSQPKVMLASSGMGNMGVNSFLLPETLKGRRNTVVFCGYCAENTTGYKILVGQQKTITSNIDGVKEIIHIKAHIENLTGLSSHASGKEIIRELLKAEKKKMKHVIIVHGDSKGDRITGLRDMVDKAYKGSVKIHIPKTGQKIKLT